MKADARVIIEATLDAAAKIDRTITRELREAALAVLEGRAQAAPAQASATGPATTDHVLSRKEVAALLHCSPKSVCRYAARGLIRPVRFGAKAEKALGYSARSVDEALRSAAAGSAAQA